MIRDTSLRHGRRIRRIAETIGWDQRSAGPPFDRDLVGRRYRWSHPTNHATSQISQPCSLRRFLLTSFAFLIGVVVITRPIVAQTTAVTTDKPSAASATDEAIDSWQVLHIGNKRAGYQRSLERVEIRDKRKVIVSVGELHFQINRFGKELTLSTTLRTEETESGELLKFAYEIKNPPATVTRSEGVVSDKDLEITSVVAGKTDKRRIPWEADAKSPAYPERFMRGKPLKPGEAFSTKVFVPEFGKFTKVSYTADEIRPIKLLDAKEHSLLLVKVSFAAIPDMNMRQYVDSNGEVKLGETDMLGTVGRLYQVTREIALQTIAGAELDLAINTLVAIDPPIKDAHRKKKIVYRITSKEDSPERSFVSGGTQQVKRLSDTSIELTVTSKPLPPVNARVVATDAKYVAATRFLQSRDPAVVEHADRAAAGETDPSRIAARMEKYVQEKIKKKNFSTAMASASEVAQKMEGDCTEHAVLLAAMLRAKRVPARIAAGLVYVESLNSFGGHMWTEAFIGGEWIPLDATLGRGGIGAAHLKMAESAMDEESPLPITTFMPLYNALGKLKIEVLKAE